MVEMVTGLSDAARAELLDRASDEDGELSVSSLQPLADPLVHPDMDLDDLADEANDLGIDVVDDTIEPSPRYAPTGFSTDPVRQYLNQASRYDLLDAEKESDLAKRYQAGLVADQLLTRSKDLDPKRRARLTRLREDGRRAKEQMINANLRLVVPTARKYAGSDYPLVEALQDGNIGLIRAVEKFDHTKGYKFSTYAVWWIRQGIQRGLAARARTVRVPTQVWEESSKIRRAESRLRTTLERDPTDEEIAAESGLKPKRVREVKDALRPLTSLDRPVGEAGDISLGDLVPDVSEVGPDLDATLADIRARLIETMRPLPERERVILELRYGLRDGETRTLEQVGLEVGLTRERVRQLEKAALGKLRDPAAQQGLREVFDTLAAA